MNSGWLHRGLRRIQKEQQKEQKTMIIDSDIARQMYMLADAELSKLGRSLADMQLRAKATEEAMDRWSRILDAVKGETCTDCGGQGQVRTFLAQDESRIEPCATCTGSGLKRR